MLTIIEFEPSTHEFYQATQNVTGSATDDLGAKILQVN